MADGTSIESYSSWGLQPDEDSLDDRVVVWTATGTANSVAEIGEILAWLVAALSLSNLPKGICVSEPAISSAAIRPGGLDKFAHCKISSTLWSEEHNTADTRSVTSSNCWADILGNTVYVKGYPTAGRAEHHTGMEVSLATMIHLVRSRRLSRFKGRFCIKSYCSIIMPTQKQGDFIYWHLVTNRSGEYLSYTDDKVQRLWGKYPRGLVYKSLERSRHILGWCDNIQNLAGTYELNLPSTCNHHILLPLGIATFGRSVRDGQNT